MRAVIVVAVWAMVLAPVGCKFSELDSELISQLCAEFETCCTAAGRPVDGAKCRAHYSALAPAAGFDQAKADTCLREVAALGDEKCAWLSPATPTCQQIFAGSGTANPGEACQNGSDCALSAEGQVRCVRAVVDDVAVVQQCQLLLSGVETSYPCVANIKDGLIHFFGDRDTPPTEGYLCDAADGLVCSRNNGASSTDACEPLPAVGEFCNLAGGCVPAAYCDFIDSVCKDRVPVGAACWSDDMCQPTSYCQPSDNANTCAVQQPNGTPCTMDAECLVKRCTNHQCGPSNDFALVFLCGAT